MNLTSTVLSPTDPIAFPLVFAYILACPGSFVWVITAGFPSFISANDIGTVIVWLLFTDDVPLYNVTLLTPSKLCFAFMVIAIIVLYRVIVHPVISTFPSSSGATKVPVVSFSSTACLSFSIFSLFFWILPNALSAVLSSVFNPAASSKFSKLWAWAVIALAWDNWVPLRVGSPSKLLDDPTRAFEVWMFSLFFLIFPNALSAVLAFVFNPRLLSISNKSLAWAVIALAWDNWVPLRVDSPSTLLDDPTKLFEDWISFLFFLILPNALLSVLASAFDPNRILLVWIFSLLFWIFPNAVSFVLSSVFSPTSFSKSETSPFPFPFPFSSSLYP